MDALGCRNLRKSYGTLPALDGVDLSFPTSGITAIIGPNGAGKTTLINVITGFVRPDSGSCLLGRREITGLPPERIVKLGISRTFQEVRLITRITALENVMLARQNQPSEGLLSGLLRPGRAGARGRNREEAMRIIGLVGLGSVVKDDTLAGEMSYGQQKLLTLACCLATGAGILILDEPVAGVSPETVKKILEALRALSDEGKSIIFIEHDIPAVKAVADTVIVMDEGRVTASGIPSEVLSRPEIMEAYIA